VITPRITRLLRVPDLQAMHRVLATRVDPPASVSKSSTEAIVVPTSGAREALTRTLARSAVVSGSSPTSRDIVTRDELYARLHAALANAPAMLSAFEREVLLGRAAHMAEAKGAPAPFRLRPGLLVEILAFYDELRRRDRTLADFDRLMTDSLAPSIEIDRGAERMFRQTRFLVAAFDAFEQLVAASGRLDEHALRQRLIASDQPGASPYWRMVVTVADQTADPRGLWTADFDLFARLPGVERLDVVATENVLATGFHQRIHDLLPGIVEERSAEAAAPPILVTPPRKQAEVGSSWFVLRDREEELVAIARGDGIFTPSDRAAVIFQRPLPYLYLARNVFADAGRPYQAVDALPLAAEPFAAALDLVFAFLIAEANRASTIDLLSSPQWRLPALADSPTYREDVAALDAKLKASKYLGGWSRLEALGTEPASAKATARQAADRAIQAAVAAAEALRPVREAASASDQIQALLRFVRDHERLPDANDPWSARHLRSRAAVIDALESLAHAHARHDDEALTPDRLAGTVRRWIEGQTFAPTTGSDGVWLLDAAAAPYADVDEVRIVGLTEHDWPERTRRSIFYPGSLLTQLGWPNELDRLSAGRARFQDLLRLPRARMSVSTFTLEDDAIVSPSSFLEEIDASGLVASVHDSVSDTGRDSHLSPPDTDPSGHLSPPDTDPSAGWLELRRSRSPIESDIYHGAAGPREPVMYAISHVERYLECPFKYFAARVLKLGEERDEESGLTPQERGLLLHEVFETFFATWQERGGGAITSATLGEALEVFASVAEATLAHLPEGDRALERTYLLGSAVAAGLGERAFTFEIEHDIDVVERLLEHPLEGAFELTGADGPRRVQIRAKADRIDLLSDGTLRVIDYKLGRAPKTAKALQLPIYGVCAEQDLKGRHGKEWNVSRAGYVAFKERNAFVSLSSNAIPLEQALEDGEKRLVAAIDRIERGEFPVDPEEPFLCTRCGYAGVCRKDYVGDE
jgi:RecB family exonuclease